RSRQARPQRAPRQRACRRRRLVRSTRCIPRAPRARARPTPRLSPPCRAPGASLRIAALLSLLTQQLALLGGHLSPALAEPLALLGGHRLPAAVILECARSLLGRESLPLLEVSLREGPLLGREIVQALDRGRRALGGRRWILAPGEAEIAERQHGAQHEQGRQAAKRHRSFASLGVGAGRGPVPCAGIDSRMRIRARICMRLSISRSRARSVPLRRSRSSSICAQTGG